MKKSLLLLILATACSGESIESESAENTETESGSESTESEAVEETVPPTFEVHEWGLIDVLDNGVEVAAGPGNANGELPSHDSGSPSGTPMRPSPAVPTSAGRRKPVLYVHNSGEPFSLVASVTLTGEVAEHWPPVPLRVPSAIEWSVEVGEPGTCETGAYPGVADAACINVADGYCELADLETYETADGACLTVDGETYDHLFYRGRNGDFETGLSVSQEDGAVVITNNGIESPVGRIFVLDRRSGVLAGSVEFPAKEQTATVSVESLSADGVDAVRSGISELLRSEGLTNDEAQAFERAWFDEFFGSGETGGAPQVPFAVLYFIPAEQHSRISELSFEPAAAEVARVFMARIAIN